MLSASHPMVRASVSSDRIHLLGGGENEVYEAIRESQNNLHALLAEPWRDRRHFIIRLWWNCFMFAVGFMIYRLLFLAENFFSKGTVNAVLEQT